MLVFWEVITQSGQTPVSQMGKTLCSSSPQRRSFLFFFFFLCCPYFLIDLLFLGIERVEVWGFGLMDEYINVTIISGHPVVLQRVGGGSFMDVKFRKDKHFCHSQTGTDPRAQAEQQKWSEHQNLEPSFQQGCVPEEGLSGYRRENLGSPQATL